MIKAWEGREGRELALLCIGGSGGMPLSDKARLAWAWGRPSRDKD